jgi:uncharacterized protein (DUF885 family)
MTVRRPLLALFVLALLPGVQGPARAADPVPAPVATPPAAAALDRLCDEYWQGLMKAAPTWATQLGDRRYDARLDDNSPAGRERRLDELRAIRARAEAIDPAALDPGRRTTRGLLIGEVDDALAQAACRFDEWVVDPLNGPQVDFTTLGELTPIRTKAEADAFVERVRAMGPYLDQHVANLSRGLADGRTAVVEPVEKTIAQLAGLEALDPARWSMVDVARRPRPAGFAAADSARFEKALTEAVRERVKPAFARYHAFLRDRLRPAARPQDKPGLAALPGGVASYANMIKVHTSLPKTPEELHALGLAEIARIRGELSALGAKTLGTADVASIQKSLRGDPALHFSTAEEIEAKAREALARAEAKMGDWFGLLPKAPCAVKRMSDLEAPQSTIAYYQQPSTDGSRPGLYMINTWAPTTRPRYEAEALAFHEAVPGHHLQIAIAQELTGLPEFRKHTGTTAFAEGWGLYAERLSEEMGLYSGDTDRFGTLSFEAWRASRLVVDTGLHALGWTRQQAIDYMVENTVLAPNNIANEVDRYITWPGQAVAYKVGQLEILRLREDARKRLGARFDIKGFHDAVLSQGAVTLPVLAEQVESWVRRVEANP